MPFLLPESFCSYLKLNKSSAVAFIYQAERQLVTDNEVTHSRVSKIRFDEKSLKNVISIKCQSTV